MASSSATAPNARVNLLAVVPSKGMSYGATGTVTHKKTADAAILAALKAACTDRSSYTKLMEGDLTAFKRDVDAMLGEVFSKAASGPLVTNLLMRNDGMDFLTELQAHFIWANDLDETAFCEFFSSLVKAHQKWDEETALTLQLVRNDYSKTSTEIASFLKMIGKNAWAGLDAEVELLKVTDG
ncbi:hypothetical protein PG994_005706 [Apiospora phragmitis]|uniref:Uncharacterized protein n=1 Tax=Apiospora phragmitis TaxID=2905665 RepID=A0ABR1VD09_9PEZI